MFLRYPLAYEVLVDEQQRRNYDASGYAHSSGGGGGGGGGPPPPPFDYEAFFKRFDKVLRKHHEAHLKAVREMGGEGAARHVADHIRQHLKQQRAAEAAHHALVRRQQNKAKAADGTLTMMDKFDFEDLFEDMTDEERDTFDEHIKEQGGSGDKGSGTETCRTISEKVNGGVTTRTECTMTT